MKIQEVVKVMSVPKIKTTLVSILVCLPLLLSIVACHRGGAPGSVAAAEAKIKKENKAKAKATKKAKKQAEKRFWSMQSKEAKKSIKRNKRMQKRKARNLD
jgi:hypothetical protein